MSSTNINFPQCQRKFINLLAQTHHDVMRYINCYVTSEERESFRIYHTEIDKEEFVSSTISSCYPVTDNSQRSAVDALSMLNIPLGVSLKNKSIYSYPISAGKEKIFSSKRNGMYLTEVPLQGICPEVLNKLVTLDSNIDPIELGAIKFKVTDPIRSWHLANLSCPVPDLIYSYLTTDKNSAHDTAILLNEMLNDDVMYVAQGLSRFRDMGDRMTPENQDIRTRLLSLVSVLAANYLSQDQITTLYKETLQPSYTLLEALNECGPEKHEHYISEIFSHKTDFSGDNDIQAVYLLEAIKSSQFPEEECEVFKCTIMESFKTENPTLLARYQAGCLMINPVKAEQEDVSIGIKMAL